LLQLQQVETGDKQLQHAANIKPSIADMPLLEYAENFWKFGSKYIEDKEYLEKKKLSLNYILCNQCKIKNKAMVFPGFQGLKVSELTKDLIRDWMLFLSKNGSSGDDVNKSVKALRVPVKRAYDYDLIPVYPFAGISKAAHTERRRGILTLKEIQTLLDTPIKDVRSRLAIYLPIICSMRIGEVRGLKWGDISNRMIYINNNWQDKEGLKDCKWDSSGYVPMPNVVSDLLNELYKIAPLNGDNDYVMSIKPYMPLHKDTIWKMFKKELLSIGIDEDERKKRNIVYHSMRHDFVIFCRAIGLSDFEIRMLARWKDDKQLQRYGDHIEAIDYKNIGAKMDMPLLPAPQSSVSFISGTVGNTQSFTSSS